MKSHILALMTILLVVFTMPAHADKAADDLRKEIQALKQRVSDLEQRPGAAATQAVPFSAMEHLENQMEEAFDDVFNRNRFFNNGMFDTQVFYQDSPLEKTKNGYQMKINVSGFDKNDIRVNARDGMLTVSGKTSKEANRQNPNVTSSTETYGAFMRKIALPADAMPNAVRTSREGDNLIITVPKRP